MATLNGLLALKAASNTKGYKIVFKNGESITCDKKVAKNVLSSFHNMTDNHVRNEIASGMMESRKSFVHTIQFITGP